MATLWPHQSKTPAISGTSPCKFQDGNASGRRGCDGPNLHSPGLGSSQPLQDKLPHSCGWLVETKSVLSLTQQTEGTTGSPSLKDPSHAPYGKKSLQRKINPLPLNLLSARVRGCQAWRPTGTPTMGQTGPVFKWKERAVLKSF